MKLLLTFLFTIAVCLLLTRPVQPQDKARDEILNRAVPGHEMEFLKTSDAFHAALEETRLPGGIVKTFECEPDTLVQSWHPENAALNKVLDNLVATDSRFYWEEREGVLNLLPTRGEPLLLKTPVPAFSVENVLSAHDALQRLLERDEVKKSMENLHLKRGLTLFSALSNGRTFSVPPTNGTFRDALNAIARANGTAIWQYVERHCDGIDEVAIKF